MQGMSIGDRRMVRVNELTTHWSYGGMREGHMYPAEFMGLPNSMIFINHPARSFTQAQVDAGMVTILEASAFYNRYCSKCGTRLNAFQFCSTCNTSRRDQTQ